MGLETGNYISDMLPANPGASDQKSQGDDHLRLIKATVKNSFPGFAGAVIASGVDGGIVNAYTLTPATPLVSYVDRMFAVFTPSITNTSAGATLNISALGAITIKAIDGSALMAGDLVGGVRYALAYNGTNFLLLNVTKRYIDSLAFAAALPAQSLGFLKSDGSVASFGDTHTGYAQKEVKGADIASAATINLTTATGNFVHITGSVGISGITIPVGAEYTVVFDGVLTLTHSASLLLPTAANITTAVGDRMIVRGDTAGANVISYTRASGQGLIVSSVQLLTRTVISSPVATINFLNLFTADYDRYTIDVQGITVSATAGIWLRVAVAGVVDSGALIYRPANPDTGTVDNTSGPQIALSPAHITNTLGETYSIEIRNARGTATAKGVGVRGQYQIATGQLSILREGAYMGTSALSGFQLLLSTAANFTAGTIAVYGHRNS